MKKPTRRWHRRLAGPVLVLAGMAGTAAEPLVWGLQAGVVVPLQSDLRVTTGSGLNPSVGVHAGWAVGEGQVLRARLDLGSFGSADHASPAPPFQQSLHTRVKDEVLGAEYLYRPQVLGGAWTCGVGAYLVRWTVDTTETLMVPAGGMPAAGSSAWTREGLGVLGAYHWNPHLDTELRVIFSHYGYENQPARVASLNVLWHF